MAQKQFKIGLSNTDKQNMAQDVYERVLALTFNEYDTTTEYDVGDFVVYNDQLYKCISATSGAWDSSKWQLATLNDLLTDIESAVAFVNDKANVNGNYPTMTVGFADNLTPYDESSGDDQDEPFSFQATGTGNGSQPDFSTGSGALMKEKRGNTVVVNQKVNSLLHNTVNVTTTYDGDWSIFTQTDNSQYSNIDLQRVSAISGHKYLIILNADANTIFNFQFLQSDGNTVYNDYQPGKYCIMKILESANSNNLQISVNIFQTGETSPSRYVKIYKTHLIVDLTQWFGSNDNIPAHLLAHPEDFFRYYQGSLAYNTGTLVNSNGRYLKTIGRNQYKEGESYTQVIPNATYHYYNADGNTDIYYYDKDKNLIRTEYVIANSTFTTPSNCLYIAPSRTANTCISIYYDGESGYDQYYPHEELANNDTGTEILRSAGNVADIKLPDGTIKRNLYAYTFTGNENFVAATLGRVQFIFSQNSLPEGAIPSSRNLKANLICNNFENIADNYVESKGMVIAMFGYDGQAYLQFCLEVTSSDGVVDDLKAYLQSHPTTVFYELAEPTEEEGTTFSENVAIDDFGSMDFGAANGVPQGNLIFYPVDYKAFVDTLYKYTEGTPSGIALKSDLSDFLTQEDLSNGITDAAGLTYTIKKLVKTGSVCSLSVRIRNETGSSISAGTTLFTLPYGTYFSEGKSMIFACVHETTGDVQTIVPCYLTGYGDFQLGKAIENNENVFINITYTLA